MLPKSNVLPTFSGQKTLTGLTPSLHILATTLLSSSRVLCAQKNESNSESIPPISLHSAACLCQVWRAKEGDWGRGRGLSKEIWILGDICLRLGLGLRLWWWGSAPRYTSLFFVCAALIGVFCSIAVLLHDAWSCARAMLMPTLSSSIPLGVRSANSPLLVLSILLKQHLRNYCNIDIYKYLCRNQHHHQHLHRQLQQPHQQHR